MGTVEHVLRSPFLCSAWCLPRRQAVAFGAPWMRVPLPLTPHGRAAVTGRRGYRSFLFSPPWTLGLCPGVCLDKKAA